MNISHTMMSLLVFAMVALGASTVQADGKIGGRWMLQDHHGTTVTDQDFRSQFMLITFGYTFCPDICPTNLVNMSTALEILGDKAKHVAPLFVTVDPNRDTVSVMREYVSHFDDRIIGLTGGQPFIDSISKRYKIVADIHRPKDWMGKEDYIVDHTASIFMMGPDGEFLVKFAHGMPPQDMANRISDFLPKGKPDE